MSHIRVLIHGVPQMLRDILEQAISAEPDMEVVSRMPRPVPSVDAAPAPDAVVVGGNGRESGGAPALLFQWPRSRLLLISERGHNVSMYELVPRGHELGELSPSQLIEAIRSGVHHQRSE
jgi:hypothetical protein